MTIFIYFKYFFFDNYSANFDIYSSTSYTWHFLTNMWKNSSCVKAETTGGEWGPVENNEDRTDHSRVV